MGPQGIITSTKPVTEPYSMLKTGSLLRIRGGQKAARIGGKKKIAGDIGASKHRPRLTRHEADFCPWHYHSSILYGVVKRIHGLGPEPELDRDTGL